MGDWMGPATGAKLYMSERGATGRREKEKEKERKRMGGISGM